MKHVSQVEAILFKTFNSISNIFLRHHMSQLLDGKCFDDHDPGFF